MPDPNNPDLNIPEQTALSPDKPASATPKVDLGFLGQNAPSNIEMVPSPYAEVGSPALRQASGYILEEQLRQLDGAGVDSKANKTWNEMGSNDATVGAILFILEMMMRKINWIVDPFSQEDDDIEAAEFLKSCLSDMDTVWEDVIMDIITEFQFGWSCLEIVYKRRLGPESEDPTTRSSYDDGLIGWRKLAGRAQESLQNWVFDEDGEPMGWWQWPPFSGNRVFLPMEKIMLFRTTNKKNNPQGRALAPDTPLLTGDGWKTMGTVQCGDTVFDESGMIRYVTGKSEVWENRACYKIIFNSGEEIIADENHLWSVTTAAERNLSGQYFYANKAGKFLPKTQPRVITTKELFSKFRETVCFSPGVPVKIDQPIQHGLLVDPYILGYWLGDGDTRSGAITVSNGDLESLKANVELAGYSWTYTSSKESSNKGRLYITGLITDLRSIGVLYNKHIPENYLRSGFEQRLALLQGLMDSDGCSPAGGKRPSYFCNSNLDIINGVRDIVSTLGCVPMRTVQKYGTGNKNNVVNGRSIIRRKDSHRVLFWATFPVHRLERKAKQQKINNNGVKARRFFVRSIVPVEPQSTVCIEVDGPNHLFLCGKTMIPTHNSLLRSAFTSWFRKTNLERIEAIGVERDLAGIPLLYVDPSILDKNASPDLKSILMEYQKIIKNVRADQQAGLIFPAVFNEAGTHRLIEFTLISTGSRRQVDTDKIIKRYAQNIAMCILADFVLIGHDAVGSFALVEQKYDMFILSLGSFADSIASVFNKNGIRKLWEINGFPTDRLPRLLPSELERQDIAELSLAAQQLTAAGWIKPGGLDDENYWRTMAGLPKRTVVPPQQGEAVTEDNYLAHPDMAPPPDNGVPGTTPNYSQNSGPGKPTMAQKRRGGLRNWK